MGLAISKEPKELTMSISALKMVEGMIVVFMLKVISKSAIAESVWVGGGSGAGTTRVAFLGRIAPFETLRRISKHPAELVAFCRRCGFLWRSRKSLNRPLREALKLVIFALCISQPT
jgi:hypothetical protein